MIPVLIVYGIKVETDVGMKRKPFQNTSQIEIDTVVERVEKSNFSVKPSNIKPHHSA